MYMEPNNQILRQTIQSGQDPTVRWEGSRRHVSLIKKLALTQEYSRQDGDDPSICIIAMVQSPQDSPQDSPLLLLSMVRF